LFAAVQSFRQNAILRVIYGPITAAMFRKSRHLQKMSFLLSLLEVVGREETQNVSECSAKSLGNGPI